MSHGEGAPRLPGVNRVWPPASVAWTHSPCFPLADTGGIPSPRGAKRAIVRSQRLVGSALALRNRGRLPVAVFGDGDYLMGVSALWTAARHRIPMLIVIANNAGYYIDEQHQLTTPLARRRPTETASVGQRISDPQVDILAMAKAQGFEGLGPVRHRRELADAISAGVDAVERGECSLIDVRIAPDYEGYPR